VRSPVVNNIPSNPNVYQAPNIPILNQLDYKMNMLNDDKQIEIDLLKKRVDKLETAMTQLMSFIVSHHPAPRR
jgi:hypothetical protein